MTRIFSLVFGLLAAAAALYVLGARMPLPGVAARLPHDSIDADSRNRLNSVLRDADR